MEAIAVIALITVLAFVNYKTSPSCRLCGSRHHGRCIYNPRAGRFMSRSGDGLFDFYDPNK